MSKPKRLSRHQLLTMMYRNDFVAFVKLAYPIVHRGRQLQKNWHIDVMTDALHGCLRGEHNRLAIHAPPRSLKSFVASIAFPAFALGRDPTLKVMSIVANQQLAADLCQSLCRLLSSDHYRTLFPHIRSERKRNGIYLTHGGSFVSSPFFLSPIGRGADILIVDDPVSPADAKNDHFDRKVAEWFTTEVVPRLNDKASSIAILVMQRLARDDLGSVFFRGQARKTLVFSAVSRHEEKWKLPSGEIFVRPSRSVLNDKVDTIENMLDTYYSIGFGDFCCQYLQDPNENRYISGPRYYPFDTTDWVPEKGAPEVRWMFRNSWYVKWECFGVGVPPPYLTKNPLSDEQYDEYVIWQQAKLVREMAEDCN